MTTISREIQMRFKAAADPDRTITITQAEFIGLAAELRSTDLQVDMPLAYDGKRHAEIVARAVAVWAEGDTGLRFDDMSAAYRNSLLAVGRRVVKALCAEGLFYAKQPESHR